MIFERGSGPEIIGDVDRGDVDVVDEGEAVSLIRCWFDFERDSFIWIVFFFVVL